MASVKGVLKGFRKLLPEYVDKGLNFVKLSEAAIRFGKFLRDSGDFAGPASKLG
jgi:hypothetical protein